MRRFVIAFSVAVLVCALAIQAQTTAPKPGPEHKKAEVFVGHWAYEVEYKAGPLGPGGKATGDYTAQMILGGFFVRGLWVERGASGETRGNEIFGYDPLNKNYAHSQFQDDGSLGSGAFTVNGNVWNYAGAWVIGGKKYLVKMTATFAADLMSVAGKTEISTDGNSWAPFFDFKYTKIKPAPKK
jgi:hypothetical protein